jgi:hypothetical protein
MRKTVSILFVLFTFQSVFSQYAVTKNCHNHDIQWLVDNINSYGSGKYQFFLGQEGAHCIFTFDFKADSTAIIGAIYKHEGRDKISMNKLHKKNQKIRFDEIGRVINNDQEVTGRTFNPKIGLVKFDSTQFEILFSYAQNHASMDSALLYFNKIARQNKVRKTR